jgi:hypothetical protein
MRPTPKKYRPICSHWRLAKKSWTTPKLQVDQKINVTQNYFWNGRLSFFLRFFAVTSSAFEFFFPVRVSEVQKKCELIEIGKIVDLHSSTLSLLKRGSTVYALTALYFTALGSVIVTMKVWKFILYLKILWKMCGCYLGRKFCTEWGSRDKC